MESPFLEEEIFSRFNYDINFLIELGQIFITNSKQHLELLKEAIKNKDYLQLEKSAHTLKGTASNFGDITVVNIAYKIEIIARTGKIEDAETLIPLLEEELNHLHKELNKLTIFV